MVENPDSAGRVTLSIPPPVRAEDHVVGVPDLTLFRTAQIIGLAIIALLGVVLVWGSGMIVEDAPLPALLLKAAVAAIAIGGIFLASRQRFDAFCEVNGDYLEYGAGDNRKRIYWRDVVRDKTQLFDVELESSLGQYTRYRWVLSVRAKDGTVERHRVPLELIPGRSRCSRFRNAFELRRAVLLRLATIPGQRLRFYPLAFAQAGIDFRTWRPARSQPEWKVWLAVALLLAMCGGVIFAAIEYGWGPGWIAVALVATFAGWLAAMLMAFGAAADDGVRVVQFR
ncbi:hypothetical protein [Inquilinus sp. CAU 1745]|uniref:hypothetical protein n=1 Tax=Inquilinus sp. CAU 1745 TaxID=3140369 RepID=UPI00325B964E